MCVRAYLMISLLLLSVCVPSLHASVVTSVRIDVYIPPGTAVHGLKVDVDGDSHIDLEYPHTLGALRGDLRNSQATLRLPEGASISHAVLTIHRSSGPWHVEDSAVRVPLELSKRISGGGYMHVPYNFTHLHRDWKNHISVRDTQGAEVQFAVSDDGLYIHAPEDVGTYRYLIYLTEHPTYPEYRIFPVFTALEGPPLLYSAYPESREHGRFSQPKGVAADQGYLYVADGGNSRVLVFTADGDYRYTISHPDLSCPAALHARNGLLAVSNPCNSTVLVFRNQALVNTLGVRDEFGRDDAHFTVPWGVFIDASGDIYVADAGNARIVVFESPYSKIPESIILANGTIPRDVWVGDTTYILDSLTDTLYSWGSHPTPVYAGFVNPLSLTRSPDGRLYVADTGSSSVLALSGDGVLLKRITGFRYPSGTVYSSGLYVVDTLSNRVVHIAPGYMKLLPAEYRTSSSAEVGVNGHWYTFPAAENISIKEPLEDHCRELTEDGMRYCLYHIQIHADDLLEASYDVEFSAHVRFTLHRAFSRVSPEVIPSVSGMGVTHTVLEEDAPPEAVHAWCTANAAEPCVLDLDDYFTDEGALTYDVAEAPPELDYTLRGSVLTLLASTGGSYTLTIRATDTYGQSTTGDVLFNVFSPEVTPSGPECPDDMHSEVTEELIVPLPPDAWGFTGPADAFQLGGEIHWTPRESGNYTFTLYTNSSACIFNVSVAEIPRPYLKLPGAVEGHAGDVVHIDVSVPEGASLELDGCYICGGGLCFRVMEDEYTARITVAAGTHKTTHAVRVRPADVEPPCRPGVSYTAAGTDLILNISACPSHEVSVKVDGAGWSTYTAPTRRVYHLDPGTHVLYMKAGGSYTTKTLYISGSRTHDGPMLTALAEYLPLYLVPALVLVGVFYRRRRAPRPRESNVLPAPPHPPALPPVKPDAPCAVCLGNIKPLTPYTHCPGCGDVMHTVCAARTEACPSCGSPLEVVS